MESVYLDLNLETQSMYPRHVSTTLRHSQEEFSELIV